MKLSIVNKLKLFFSILFIVLFISCCFLNQTNNAYAKQSPGTVFVPGSGTGGVGQGSLNLIIDEKHSSEISNFATISNNSVTGYDSLVCPIHSRPNADTNYNELDYVIYMIKQLEEYATEYMYGVRKDVNNGVLGYIRSINKNYTGEDEHSGTTIFDTAAWGYDNWPVLAGSVHRGFGRNVEAKEIEKNFMLTDFFGNYLQSEEDYNDYLHGFTFTTLNKQYKLPDPLGSGQAIDLIHMIASIDGVYENTGFNGTVCNVALGNKHFHRDLTSWLGDLQTLARDIADKRIDVNGLEDYSPEMVHIDFNDFISMADKKVTSFSCDDLLADIDAFNIANFYLNNEWNLLSDSIIGYYTTVNKDNALKGNRYFSFIFNSTLELNHSSTGSLEDDFRNEVCNAMNVKYENGNYYDCEYYSEDSYNLKLLNGGETKPSFAIRKYCVKLFCDYIIAMSHRF